MKKVVKILTMIGLAPWTLWMRQRLNKISVLSNDYIFGLNDSGYMCESILLDLIDNLPAGLSEIYFHPELQEDIKSVQGMTEIQDSPELQALISPKVKERLAKIKLAPQGFSDLINS